MKIVAVLPFVLGLALAANVPEEYLRDESASPKIVGGSEASKNEFPYQLRALIKRGDRYGLCGASIINSKYALTAAHCIDPTPDAITLNVGYLDVTVASGGEYDVQVDRIKKHARYNPNTFENDIALLRISTTFKDAPGSKAISLVPERTSRTGTAVASGWGTTSQGGSTSNILMKVPLPVLDNSTCSDAYGSTYNPSIMLCAGYVEGGKDTCQGDSGGPLVLNDEQIGITSFGNGCANEGYPGIYTRVAAYRRWIDYNAV